MLTSAENVHNLSHFLLVKLFEGLIVYYININMNGVKNLTKYFFIILFFLNSCVSLPGINKSPSKKKANKKNIESEYSINDVGINLININTLSEMDIDFYNKKKNRRS